MNEILNINQVEDKIIMLRNQAVLLDSDVAVLYGVATKEINQAVKNNPKKFPLGYIFELDSHEIKNLRSKFLTANLSKTRVAPKAFTEKGLYMLATILKGERAIEATIEIVETFAKLKELSRTVAQLSEVKDEKQQKTLMQKGGELITELLGNEMQTTDTETTLEINFAMLKLKHTIKQKKKQPNNP